MENKVQDKFKHKFTAEEEAQIHRALVDSAYLIRENIKTKPFTALSAADYAKIALRLKLAQMFHDSE